MGKKKEEKKKEESKNVIPFNEWVEDVVDKAKKEKAVAIIPLEYITGEDWLRRRRRMKKEKKKKNHEARHREGRGEDR